MISNDLLQEIDAGAGETLSRLARRVPRTRLNKPVTLSCLVRWIIDGARGLNGERVKLEAVRLGGKWISTPGALRRFILAQTPNGNRPDMPRTADKRQRASDRAARELEAAGI